MTTNTKEQWKNNNCLIYAYKSHRKNAKIISSVTMRHLITQNDNGCLSEEHILQYFVLLLPFRYPRHSHLKFQPP